MIHNRFKKLYVFILLGLFNFSAFSQSRNNEIRADIDSSSYRCDSAKNMLNETAEDLRFRLCYAILQIFNTKKMDLTVSKYELDIETQIFTITNGKYLRNEGLEGTSCIYLTDDTVKNVVINDSVIKRNVSFPPTFMAYEKGKHKWRYVFYYSIQARMYAAYSKWYYLEIK